MNEQHGRDESPLIELKEIQKTYRMGDQEVRALDGVTLSLARGSFVAIMGASGSGKSTMLNMLGCLDRPTSGTYHLAGENVGVMNDDQITDLRLRKLGFVFQSFHLIPQLTVRENIELPLYYQGWEPQPSMERAEMLAGLVGLDQRLGHRPMELSGGQQQRVAVARALANDPDVLLADEPTGNLDSKTSTQIMELLVSLNAKGKSIMMVTHEDDIAAYAKTQIVMRDGKILSIQGEAPMAAVIDAEPMLASPAVLGGAGA